MYLVISAHQIRFWNKHCVTIYTVYWIKLIRNCNKTSIFFLQVIDHFLLQIWSAKEKDRSSLISDFGYNSSVLLFPQKEILYVFDSDLVSRMQLIIIKDKKFELCVFVLKISGVYKSNQTKVLYILKDISKLNYIIKRLFKRDFTIEKQSSLSRNRHWLKVSLLYHDWLRSLNKENFSCIKGKWNMKEFFFILQCGYLFL